MHELLARLQGLKDPEAKRKAIGAGFIEVFNDFAKGFDRKPRSVQVARTSNHPAQQPSSVARNLHTLQSRSAVIMQELSASDMLHEHEQMGPCQRLISALERHHMRGRL